MKQKFVEKENRTYIGALPENYSSNEKAKTINPVILFDEISDGLLIHMETLAALLEIT